VCKSVAEKYCSQILIYYVCKQARAQTFWGAGAQTQKKGTQCQKKILKELNHKQQYTDEAVLDLRFLWAASDR